MAQLVLSNVGSVVGGRLLPNGVAAFGGQISGAAIGQAVGSVAGAYLDARYLMPPIEGPRISEFHVTQSREGASVPVVCPIKSPALNVISSVTATLRVSFISRGVSGRVATIDSTGVCM